MSQAAEDRRGFNSLGPAIKYRKSTNHIAGGLEAWPLNEDQKVFFPCAKESTYRIARVISEEIAKGRKTCTFKMLYSNPVVFDLIKHDILHSVHTNSGAWYLRFTAFSRAWCAWILSMKNKCKEGT